MVDDKVCCSCGTSLQLSYTGKDLQWEVTWNEKGISKNQPEGKQAEKRYRVQSSASEEENTGKSRNHKFPWLFGLILFACIMGEVYLLSLL